VGYSTVCNVVVAVLVVPGFGKEQKSGRVLCSRCSTVTNCYLTVINSDCTRIIAESNLACSR